MSARPMMTVEEVRGLRPGALVRITIPCMGCVSLSDGGELEINQPAGAAARVDEVWFIGGTQGWGVTIGTDIGITNVFDEGDDCGRFALEPLRDSPETRQERVDFLIANAPSDYPASDLAADVARINRGNA